MFEISGFGLWPHGQACQWCIKAMLLSTCHHICSVSHVFAGIVVAAYYFFLVSPCKKWKQRKRLPACEPGSLGILATNVGPLSHLMWPFNTIMWPVNSALHGLAPCGLCCYTSKHPDHMGLTQHHWFQTVRATVTKLQFMHTITRTKKLSYDIIMSQVSWLPSFMWIIQNKACVILEYPCNIFFQVFPKEWFFVGFTFILFRITLHQTMIVEIADFLVMGIL